MIIADLTFLQLYDYANKATIPVILVFLIYGGYKGWWVFGWQYKDICDRFFKMEEEKNAWRETALRGKDIAVDAFRELRDRRR